LVFFKHTVNSWLAPTIAQSRTASFLQSGFLIPTHCKSWTTQSVLIKPSNRWTAWKKPDVGHAASHFSCSLSTQLFPPGLKAMLRSHPSTHWPADSPTHPKKGINLWIYDKI